MEVSGLTAKMFDLPYTFAIPDILYYEELEKEFEYLRSKYSVAKFAKTRVNPKVFTEQGVYMLVTILQTLCFN